MKIQPININTTTSYKGVYFVPNGTVFSKEIALSKSKDFELTEKGAKYIRDTKITEEIKSKLENIPFIKNLSKNFDVFIHYHVTEPDKNSSILNRNFAMAKIIWTDYKNKFANVVFACGESKDSMEEANKKLYKILEEKKFDSKIPSLQKIFI